MKPPVVDYRKLRWNNINTKEYKHLKWLLYWPVFLLMFLYVEQFYQVEAYHVVYCSLDDKIPFQELFVFPYLFWFVFLVGMHLYTLLYDIENFERFMKYITITFSIGIMIFLIYPTCQELRPREFPRDNALTRFMAGFYGFDTSTNVCPSLHVVGSLAVLFASMHINKFRTPGWRVFFWITAILVCMATVFLKQHSVVDVIAGLFLSVGAYPMCYGSKFKALTLRLRKRLAA